MIELQLRPPRKERLADILYGQIVEQILSGAFKEGDRLPTEHQISSAFEVSRPVVREALIRLQADGLIYARRGAGTFVRTSPPQAITQLAQPSNIAGYLRSLEVRLALEPVAASHAAQRRTNTHLSEIAKSMERLEAKLTEGELAMEEDFAFHRAIATASGNELFVDQFDNLERSVRGSMNIGLGLTKLGSDVRRQAVLREHEQIIAAVGAGDGESAALYMRYHLTRSRERIINSHRET